MGIAGFHCAWNKNSIPLGISVSGSGAIYHCLAPAILRRMSDDAKARTFSRGWRLTTMNKTYAAIDGNEAAAKVAYKLNEVISIYPITPASPM